MRQQAGKWIDSKFGGIILLVLLLGINFLASIFHTRLDLTKEKRYTLSKATRDLLVSLDDKVEIDVFLTGEFNAGFRKLANSTEEFLGLLKDRNGSKIQYRFVSPLSNMPGTNVAWGDTLIGMGARPINLKVQLEAGESSNIIYPLALIRYKGGQELVNLYEGSSRNISQEEINSSEATMEYQFAKTLDRLVHPEKPMIAYSFGNGEPADERVLGLRDALQHEYTLLPADINKEEYIPDTIKVLIVAKPTKAFSEEEKLKIDQYVMRGGKLLFFIDALIAEQDSLRFKPETIAFDRNLNLTDLLFKYGVRINPSLIMDLQCDFLPFAVGGDAGNPQYEFLHWNYYPLFEAKNNHTIVKNLGLVASRFVNSIDTIITPGIEKTVLLSSSPNSRVISTPALISLNENRNAPQDANFRQNNIPAGILLEGKFTSLYRNRLSRSQLDTLNQMGVPFQAESVPNKMIIVGDGDIVLNDVSTKVGPLPMGMNLFTMGSQYEYTFANRQFLLNCLEYLVNKPAIIETRNKNIVLRLLDSQKIKASKLKWQLLNIVLPILLVILAAVIYQFIRKRKYAGEA